MPKRRQRPLTHVHEESISVSRLSNVLWINLWFRSSFVFRHFIADRFKDLYVLKGKDYAIIYLFVDLLTNRKTHEIWGECINLLLKRINWTWFDSFSTIQNRRDVIKSCWFQCCTCRVIDGSAFGLYGSIFCDNI